MFGGSTASLFSFTEVDTISIEELNILSCHLSPAPLVLITKAATVHLASSDFYDNTLNSVAVALSATGIIFEILGVTTVYLHSVNSTFNTNITTFKINPQYINEDSDLVIN